MITSSQAMQLAQTYGFNDTDELLEELRGVELLWSLRDAARPAETLQARQRKLSTQLRKDPSDDLAWSEAAEIASGQRTVTFNAMTREITVEASDRNKRARTREDKHLNAVVASLDAFWEKHHVSEKPIPLTAPLRFDSPNRHPSLGVEFIAAVLDTLKVHETHRTHKAIVNRLMRLRAG